MPLIHIYLDFSPSETLVSANVVACVFSRNELLDLHFAARIYDVMFCCVVVPNLFFMYPLWIYCVVSCLFRLALAPLSCSLLSCTPPPLCCDVLFVVAEAEFGFVPAFLREFSPFIEEGWIVYLAHYVHLLSKAKSTTSTPLGVWVGMF